jgi:hypothetical protein
MLCFGEARSAVGMGVSRTASEKSPPVPSAVHITARPKRRENLIAINPRMAGYSRARLLTFADPLRPKRSG